MKILIIHNFHRKGSSSGDDQVFKNESALLELYGNKVIRYTISNDDFDNAGVLKKILYTFSMFWSFKNYKVVKNLCMKETPDIVHIHTFFPLLSPSVLYAAKRGGCKVVVTLHDTRFICPCATSLRGMELCNKCGDGNYLRMIKYRCFKGSRIQSMIVALVFMYHRIRKSFYNQIDKYICLNDNQIELLKSVGFDQKKIEKKYNFVMDIKDIHKPIDINIPDRYVVFYGRIGEEKGIRVLMQIWDKISEIPLVVMGSGPLEDEFKAWARKKNNVYYLGYIQRDICLSIVKGGEFVIFPSIWYEGCSMVEIESENLGKAIIATDLGFSIEAINNGINGYKVSLGDIEGFIKAITDLWQNPELCIKMGINARKEYDCKYRPEDNYKQLMNIYNSICT